MISDIEFCFSMVLGTFEERLQTAKEYLKDSDFMRKVDETLKKFLDADKQSLDEDRFCFKDTRKTDNLKDYVTLIKENASKLFEFEL